MRYRDLVQFDPIDTVIQLRDADQKDHARRLVRTYVISDHMAEQLANVVIPELQFLSPRDNKGVLIVGNYGTGKSHLMSVISAIAQHADLLGDATNHQVKQAGQALAGRFKVLRVEIGSVTGSLRDILLQSLEGALDTWGAPYNFPAADQAPNNKDPIIAAVAGFRQRYPEQGILLVVDELLDYLRTREERELILDLGFLRELGEVSEHTPFRFIGGLQETLFDSPRFAFVADQLRRVRDRFAQVRIAREDIAYVVSHRLLRKTDAQISAIREHLHQFTPLYHRMAERMDEFAQLFPIHPAYIETFERVYVAEKREVLKTLSVAMQGLLDKEVPDGVPGLLSYDHYWAILRENQAMRAIPEVRQVVTKSDILEGLLRNAYTRPHLLDMALRILHALSVHRLTTGDIKAPMGATPEELRDQLCLFLPMPEPTADFLLDQVRVALQEISRTVSGKFVSRNEDNDQYYLDLDKIIDYDAKIRERGESIDESDLNRYFFDGLRQILTLSDTTYVVGHRIWFWELSWLQRGVTRPGYLFFGPPDERSTAQPPRDFYVYVLPPFFQRKWTNGDKPDEVVFRLTGLDHAFEDMVRQYAGARDMFVNAPNDSEDKRAYADRADRHLRTLTRWLRENLPIQLQVLHQGVTEPVSALLGRTQSSKSESVDDLLRIVAAHLLKPEFDERYPSYPHFGLAQPVHENERPTDALEAVRFLAGRGRTNTGVAVLKALGLLRDDLTVQPALSPYAQRYLALLHSKPIGQVVNRGELIETAAPGIQPIEKDRFFHLEPEWVVVVLLALVHHGDIVLTVDNREALEADTIERAATMAISALTTFRHFGQPRSLPVGVWVTIFEGLGLQAGLIRDENSREEAVRVLQPAVQRELEQTAALIGRFEQGLRLWNTPIFTDSFALTTNGTDVQRLNPPTVTLSHADVLPHLRGYKKLIEELARYNTVGKLRNLRIANDDLSASLADRKAVQRLDMVTQLVDRVQPLTTYLAEAMANLPAEHDWTQRANAAREALLSDVRRLTKGEAARGGPDMERELQDLKQAYVATYAALHRQRVLGPQDDERRQRLYNDPRRKAMDALAGIEMLGRSEWDAWKRVITGLPTCREFHEGLLVDAPTCPRCHLRPAQQAGAAASQAVQQLDQQLDNLLRHWRQSLRANLQSDSAQHSLQAMTPAERQPIESFLKQSDDDAWIPDGFVNAATQALHGIEAVTLPVDDIVTALKSGGLPCTVEDLQHRFSSFVQQRLRGHDARATRLTLDR